MPYGAGYLAAVAAGADVIDPRDFAALEIRPTFEAYPHIGKVLPAVGYGAAQLAALKATIDNSAADVVVSATPIDLAQLVQLRKKVVRARYEFAEAGEPELSPLIEAFVARDVAQAESALMRVVLALGGNALLRRGEPLEAAPHSRNQRDQAVGGRRRSGRVRGRRRV